MSEGREEERGETLGVNHRLTNNPTNQPKAKNTTDPTPIELSTERERSETEGDPIILRQFFDTKRIEEGGGRL